MKAPGRNVTWALSHRLAPKRVPVTAGFERKMGLFKGPKIQMFMWQMESSWLDAYIQLWGKHFPVEGAPPLNSSHLPGGAGQRKWPASAPPAGSPRSCLWPEQTHLCPRLCHPSGLTPAAPTHWLSSPGWLRSGRHEGDVGIRTEDGTEGGMEKGGKRKRMGEPQTPTPAVGDAAGG